MNKDEILKKYEDELVEFNKIYNDLKDEVNVDIIFEKKLLLEEFIDDLKKLTK